MKYSIIILICFAFACNNTNEPNETEGSTTNAAAPPAITYSVLNVYPHDTSSYTQGLEIFDNSLYESTGEFGSSKIRKTDLKTGKVLQEISIDKSLFGEGITILNGKIYQLTWQHNKVFVYDAKTFKRLQEFSWPYEGWGITNNGTSLIVSTGGSNLYFVNPADFKIQKMVGVTDNAGPVGNLNELEFVRGVVYANIYQSDYIVKIDIETGKVLGRLDLTDVLAKNNVAFDPSHKDVLNGIAYDSAKNSFYITGKWWPALFEMKLN